MELMLLLLLAVSILVSAALRKRAEEVFPCILLSIIGILHPFYCLDLLRLGRYVVYGALAAAGITAFTVLCRKRVSIREAVSPGICLFAGLCVFFILYTRNHLVGLWDELRLWGAVPKALYFTEALQLGPDALVFEIMQPYPPGMPLLVYFLTALSPVFREGDIFAVYAVFFAAMLLPTLKELKWKQYPLFLPLMLMIICAPCLFTSHGGDGAWFYGSLYIDPILGVLAGYAFFLSFSRPFDSRFSLYRFGTALLALTVIKDSGAMFALLAGINALILFLMDRERKVSRKDWLLRPVQVLVPVLLGYFLWKAVLGSYGIVSNEQGFLKNIPTAGTILALCRKIKNTAMVSLQGPIFVGKLSLTYIPCFLLLAGASLWVAKRRGKSRECFISWAAMTASVGLLALGCILSFGASLPSFQRYMSATLIMLQTFVLLQAIPALTDWLNRVQIPAARRIPAVVAGGVVFLSGVLFVAQWQGKKADMQSVIDPARDAAAAMAAVEGSTQDPADVYVLISEDPRGNSKLHHRIYYELLGSSACVRNFWNNVNIVGGESTPEGLSPEEIASIAAQWAEKLVAQGYDYVYVATVNAFTSQVLAEFGIRQAQAGDLYRIESADGEIRLVID